MKVMDDNNECGGSNTCESWLLRAQTGASNQFSLWQSSFAWRATKYQGERILLNGDYSTNQMSAFYTFESNFGTTLASVTGTDQGASTTGLTADATFSSATSADLAKQGCVDFDTPSATLASTTLCSGYSLTAPTTTIFQSSDSADFSYTGLKDVVDNIEDPS